MNENTTPNTIMNKNAYNPLHILQALIINTITNTLYNNDISTISV